LPRASSRPDAAAQASRRRFLAALAAGAASVMTPQVAAIEVNRLVAWSRGPTPALALDDLDGRRVDLKRLRGSTVLVNFWATWCEPCREEMPSFVALARRAPAGSLRVLAVNVAESRARVAQFLAAHPLDLTVLLDAHGEAAKAWQVAVYPSSFVVAPDGKVRRYVAGALDWNDPAIAGEVLGPASRVRP
jgi:thiol-disulfide isomerase/thioredoxin